MSGTEPQQATASFDARRCPNCAASLNVQADGGAHCHYCDWRREPACRPVEAPALRYVLEPSFLEDIVHKPVQSPMLVHDEPWNFSEAGATSELRPVLLLLSIAAMSAMFTKKWWTSNIPYIENDWAVRLGISAIAGWWLTCAQLTWIRDGETHERWLLTWTVTFIGCLFVWLAEP